MPKLRTLGPRLRAFDARTIKPPPAPLSPRNGTRKLTRSMPHPSSGPGVPRSWLEQVVGARPSCTASAAPRPSPASHVC